MKKLLNNYLFATTRFLDNHGNHAVASPPEKIVSAPEVKAGTIGAVGTAIAFAAAALPLESLNALYGATMVITASGIRNMHNLDSKPSYYFDTAPDRKQPIEDPILLAVLRVDHKNLKSKLMTSALFTAVPAIAVSILAPPFAFAALGTATPLFVSFITNDIGKWWRADHALRGEWNVITHTPKPDTKTVPVAKAEPAPAPTQG